MKTPERKGALRRSRQLAGCCREPEGRQWDRRTDRQTVKVKAETSPELEAQPLLDPVQLEPTAPKTGSRTPPSRGGTEARPEKSNKRRKLPPDP